MYLKKNIEIWRSIVTKIEGILKNAIKTCKSHPRVTNKILSKPSIISLLKIYKLLLVYEKKFALTLDEECLVYLLNVTEKSKGVIEGVRLSLIELVGHEASF